MAFQDFTSLNDTGIISYLQKDKQLSAGSLYFKKYTYSNLTNWDYLAEIYGSEPYALSHDTYSFVGIKGATYDLFSTSFFDPYFLTIYDNNGKMIAANNESNDGSDIFLGDAYYSQDIIFDWVAPYTGIYYVSASWNQGEYYKYYSLSVYEDLDTVQATPTTTFNGTGSNDMFTSTFRSESFYGDNGTDTVIFSGVRDSYTITETTTGQRVTSTADGTDTLYSIERLKFKDKTIALDINGNAGQAYRIYQAAFDRKPDNEGLKYWISRMDEGTSQKSVAEAFIDAAEFKNLYGMNPSNADFLSKIYSNVLNRTPDQGGYDWWLSQMDSGKSSKAAVLASFAESPENQAVLIGVIQNGIEII